jgi:hypothetical protein
MTRYPLSPRIVTLKEIRAKLRPEPEREPLPPATALRTTEQGEVQSAMLSLLKASSAPANPYISGKHLFG